MRGSATGEALRGLKPKEVWFKPPFKQKRGWFEKNVFSFFFGENEKGGKEGRGG